MDFPGWNFSSYWFTLSRKWDGPAGIQLTSLLSSYPYHNLATDYYLKDSKSQKPAGPVPGPAWRDPGFSSPSVPDNNFLHNTYLIVMQQDK